MIVLAKGTHKSGLPVVDQGMGNVITENLLPHKTGAIASLIIASTCCVGKSGKVNVVRYLVLNNHEQIAATRHPPQIRAPTTFR